MRLIDADKLEDVLAKHQTHYYGDSDYYEGISQGFNLAIYDVKEAPTIDAVEVVRCKDCKYSKYKQGELRCYIWSISSKTKEDGYCFCGARMDEEEL